MKTSIALLVAAVAFAFAAAAAQAGIPEFRACLAAHGLRTTPSAGGRVLDLPRLLSPANVLDRAFTPCRSTVRWPANFTHVGRKLRSLKARGNRFRLCMRMLGRDPGAPVVGVATLGIALHFPRDEPAGRCAKLLPAGRD